jgi:branched-chain amino acid transport system substrate-binding protein
MKNANLRLTLLAAALGAASPLCAQSLEVKIGHVAPLTGGIAHLGKDNENGARLAIEEANAAKIKIGGKEVRFSLVAEDDQADPKVGTTVAQKLGRPEVVGVRGTPQLRNLDSRLADLQRRRHPGHLGSATNPKLTEQGFKTQFRVVGRDDQQGPRSPATSRPDRKPKVVAVIDDATAYGEASPTRSRRRSRRRRSTCCRARRAPTRPPTGRPCSPSCAAAIRTRCSTAAWTRPAACSSSRRASSA